MSKRIKSTATEMPASARIRCPVPTPPWEDLDIAYSGSMQEVLLPAGVYLLKLWGAQGGNSGGTGGKGGYAEGKITISAPTAAYVYVGGQGSNVTGGVKNSGGGWNGGGNAHSDWDTAAGGGGGSDIRIGGTAITNRVIVAAGGGGGGSYGSYAGGAGGGTSGSKASDVSGGEGGTQSAGGNEKGALFQGGTRTVQQDSGGGGGGYYGGGAGYVRNRGGGGGSSYIAHSSITDGSTTANQRTGNGLIQIQKILT